MKTELDYIEKLVELVSGNELTELSVEDGEKAVIIRREKEIITAQAAPVGTPMQMPVVQQPQSASASKPKDSSEDASNKIKITSPMVGTFYKAPSPGAAPFTDVGKTISSGQVVCIIEAMKLMNEIEAEVSGKIVEICVEDGQPVEFGETLMVVEP